MKKTSPIRNWKEIKGRRDYVSVGTEKQRGNGFSIHTRPAHERTFLRAHDEHFYAHVCARCRAQTRPSIVVNGKHGYGKNRYTSTTV